jgi:CRP-like cAMP-binding protein
MLEGRFLDGFTGFAVSDVLGLIGVALYIGSYFGLQAGLIKGQGYLYALMNTAAAVCVLLSLLENFNLSSAIIQVTYILISVFGMIRFYLLRHRIHFNEEELQFLRVAAPDLPKYQARQLLNTGAWKDVQAETELTTGGSDVTHLYFLLSGAARVTVGGNQVAEIAPSSLIGEMACLTGMPASATVITTRPSRLFSFEVNTLNDFLARNLPVRHELERYFANQIGEKLVRANSALSEHRAGNTA